MDARLANGDLHLWVAGFRNHRDDVVFEILNRVASIAPGSYGILHVHDDEDTSDPNAWARWVLVRGRVRRELETALSPHIGAVEDQDPLST